MTAVLGLALVLQAAMLAMLRFRLGRTWLRRPVVLCCIASVIYQGLSQVALSFPPLAAQDPARLGIAPGYADGAALLTSGCMLAMAAAYLATQPQRAVPVTAGRETLARALDWRLLVLATVPLAVLTYAGRGYNSTYETGANATTATAVAQTFFVLLVALATAAFLIRHGTRWFLPALLLQSVVLALAGERTPILADAVAVAVILAASGHRPPARQVHAGAAIVLTAALAITGARVSGGRGVYEASASTTMRAATLAAGLRQAPAQVPGLLAQAATRLDGDAFTAAILQARHFGAPPMGPVAVPESLLLAVPSALWPSKLSHSLNPFQAQISGYSLQNINFLPTLPGQYAGYLALPWLVLLLAVLGLLTGWGERWLLASVTPARLVMLAGAVEAAMHYEAGLPTMLLSLRAALVVAVAMRALARKRSAESIGQVASGMT